MTKPEIVKVTPSIHSTDAILIHTKLKRRAVHQFDPALSKTLGHSGVRYYLAVWHANEHRWVLDKQTNNQSW